MLMQPIILNTICQLLGLVTIYRHQAAHQFTHIFFEVLKDCDVIIKYKRGSMQYGYNVDTDNDG